MGDVFSMRDVEAVMKRKCDHCKTYKDEEAFAWRWKISESGKKLVANAGSILTKIGTKV
jgi:hypothetical protein